MATTAEVNEPRPPSSPAVVVPFAVRPTAEVRPDLWQLQRPLPAHVEDDGPPTLVRFDREVPTLVAAARRAVYHDPTPWTGTAADLDERSTATAGRLLAGALDGQVGARLTVTADRLVLADDAITIDVDGHVEVGAGGDETLAGRLTAVPPWQRWLEAIALSIAEDVVLVDRGGRAVWLHVCAPSGWDPGVSGGRSLAELHGPVPGSRRLREASGALGRAIVAAAPGVRWVWGLTDDPNAAHHPRFRPPPSTAAGPVAALTFRAERQTTFPMPSVGLGAFLIRVSRAPLGEVVTTRGRARRLAEAIAALPPELARYKGVAERVDEVQAWLATVGVSQH